jgi:hypothetical protein
MTAGRAVRAGTGRGPIRVLDLEVRPAGNDDRELFVRGEAPEPVPCPVYEVVVRVGVVGEVERGEPAPTDAEEAAGLLLGAKRPPWWRRWLASEKEKLRGARWHVKG